MQESGDLNFRLYPLRFHFIAIAPIVFPRGKAGNVFRGALGFAMQDLARVARYPQPSQLFAPTPSLDGPSGIATRPRGFVLRASHLDGQLVQPNDSLHLDLHLFVTGPNAVDLIGQLRQAFEKLGQLGIGPTRGRAILDAATRIDNPAAPLDSEPMLLSLAPDQFPCTRILIDFLTPTELKSDGDLASLPEFHILFNRVRDRLSTLRALYGDGPLAVDFRALAERAALIELHNCSLTHVKVERRSSRTGQVHRIGGFIGTAEYSGDLAEFLPWLRAAEWTGVGRQTVWGKGYFRVRAFPDRTD